MSIADDEPFVVRTSESMSYGLSDSSRFRFPFSGRAGHPEIFFETSRKGSGPPLHKHPWAAWEVVLEGRVRFVVDGKEHLLEAGDGIFTPANVPHTYVVESESAKLVGLNQEGSRFEDLQRGAEPIFASGEGPDMKALQSLTEEVGVTMLGPPLGTGH